MARTTINIDDPVLKEIKSLKKKEGLAIGKIVSRLLAEALAQNKSSFKSSAKLEWVSNPMHSRVDLTDKEALYAILDRPDKDKSAGK